MIPYYVTPEAIYQALNAVDAMESITISREPWRYEESQSAFIVGRHPKESTMFEYKAASAVVHMAVTLALRNHPTAEHIWQYTTIAGQFGTDVSNFSIGLHIDF